MKLLSLMPELPAAMSRVVGKSEETVTVFYFWSQECSLCKGWPQFVQRLHEEYGSRVQSVVVHVGALMNEDAYVVNADLFFIDSDELLAAVFGVRNFPTIFIFDTSKKLRYQQSGIAENRMLISRLRKFVKD